MIEQEITLLTNGRISFQKCGNGLQFGYSKNRGVYSIKVKTSGEWNSLTIRAFWHVPDGKDPASSLVVDGYVDVPASVTAQPGSGCVTFEGSDGTKTVTSADLRYRVSANSGTEDGTEPEPGTPAWQQLVGTVKKYSDTAVEAKESAKKSADEAKQALEDTKDVKSQAIEEINSSKTAVIEEIENKKNLSIGEINSVKEDAKGELETLCDSTRDFANQAKEAADRAKASEDASKKNADDSAVTLQELKDGIASGNFKGEKGDKGDTGPQGPQGEQGPDNLVIITATANATVQGEYIPDTTYSNALADIQANKAVMIKLDNVPGRYYIPYSSSNAEILASAGTVSGSNQSIELYLIKWTAQTNTITLTGTKEGCIADGGTAGQVLVKKSDESFDTEWTDNFTIITYDGSTTSIDFDTAYNLLHSRLVILINTNQNISFNLNIYSNSIRSVASIGPGVKSLIVATLYWSKDSINFSFNPYYTIPDGGSTGQVLAKKSNAIGDTEWIAPPSSEIPEDYPQIREDVSKLKEDTAALQARQNVLIGSETGNPISVDDAFAAPLCGLTVYGKSTQDGTPSPDAPVPIVSAGDGGSVAVKVTGKNLLYLPDIEERTVDGVTYSVKNGVIKAKGAYTGQYGIRLSTLKFPVGTFIFNSNAIKGTESTNRYLDLTNNNTIGFSFHSNNLNTPKRLTENDVSYEFFLMLQFTTGDMEWQPQMLLSDKPLPYSPYREQLLTLPTPNGLPGIPVNYDGNYTDENGQRWVCDEVDLERGVKVQRVNRLKLDALSWRYELTPTNKSDTFISDVPASQDGTTRGYSLCQYAVFDGVAYDIEMKEACRCYVWIKSVTLQFKAGSGVNSVDAFSEWLKARPDASISYCLATPIETPLTPDEIAAYKALTTYAPDTVVQAGDGVGLKLDYQRDVNIAIKKLEDAVASMT